MAEKENDFSDYEDEDEDYNDDIERFRKTCELTGTNPRFKSTPSPTTSTYSISDSDSENDDLELVKKLQQTYNLQPVSMEPLSNLHPLDGLSDDSDIDDENDHQTWSAIEKRFASYIPPKTNTDNTDNQSFDSADWQETEASVLPTLQSKHTDFRHSKSSQLFIDAIKKNRSLQKLIRSKLVHIEAKIEENKKLKKRVKLLKDFQFSCKVKAGKALTQKKDARIELIQLGHSRKSHTSKGNDKKVSPLNFGPVENSHVETYRMLMRNSPSALRHESWSDAERQSLGQGIKQQFQEMMFQKSLELFSDPNASSADSDSFDDIMASITDFDITPESCRSFVPKVDWELLASLFLSGRSGAECEARWLNYEDPLINQNKWTQEEDKNLLDFLNKRGIHNWIDISTEMAHRGIHRPPFQCLARYQRSLNVNIMKRSWTAEEDAQLQSVIDICGQKDWQKIASYIEGRTGTQCSNRWKKTLDPAREKEGEWSIDEDKHLKVAVTIFGARNWNKIAQFIPGRTQAQCRSRWVNSLDPSTSFAEWTPEEDSKLIEALNQQKDFKEEIPKHGYSWSMIAKVVPRRTNKQCLRRWRVLFPHEVPLLQAARKVQRQALVSNFVDREEERPALGPCNFLALPSNVPGETQNCNRKEKRKRREEKSSKNKKDGDENVDFNFPSNHISTSKKGGKSRLKRNKYNTHPPSNAERCEDMCLDKDPTACPKPGDLPHNSKSTGRNNKRRKSCPQLKKCDQELPVDPEHSNYKEIPPSSELSRYLETPNACNLDDAHLQEELCLSPEYQKTAESRTSQVKRKTNSVLDCDELQDDVPLGWYLKKRRRRKQTI